MVAKSGPLAGVRRFLVSVCRFGATAVLGRFCQGEPLSTEREAEATFSGMRRTAEILTTLVLFAIVMAVIGWAVNASTPAVHEWLIAHVGHAGIWTFFVALWITGGVLFYREKAGRAGKAVGR